MVLFWQEVTVEHSWILSTVWFIYINPIDNFLMTTSVRWLSFYHIFLRFSFSFVNISLSLSLFSQIQAVSDGGKSEHFMCTLTILYMSHFYNLNMSVHDRRKYLISLSFLSVLINGRVCLWMCNRVEHVCTRLWRQQLQPSRHSRWRAWPCQQCAELGRLIWEAAGGPLWGPLLYGELHPTHTSVTL